MGRWTGESVTGWVAEQVDQISQQLDQAMLGPDPQAVRD